MDICYFNGITLITKLNKDFSRKKYKPTYFINMFIDFLTKYQQNKCVDIKMMYYKQLGLFEEDRVGLIFEIPPSQIKIYQATRIAKPKTQTASAIKLVGKVSQ